MHIEQIICFGTKEKISGVKALFEEGLALISWFVAPH